MKSLPRKLTFALSIAMLVGTVTLQAGAALDHSSPSLNVGLPAGSLVPAFGEGGRNRGNPSADKVFDPAVQAGAVNFGWAKRIGGVSYDNGASLAVDAKRNVYTTGNFSGRVDFDPGAGTYNLTSVGDTDIFISKLDTDGNLVWAKGFGGVLSDAGHEVVVDGDGNVYSVGGFYDTVDFDPGAGTYNLYSAGSYDIYISKLDTNGNFVWAKNVGGIDYDDGTSLVVDEAGNIYITGDFSDIADFDPSAGIYNLITTGDSDIFMSKYDPNGNLVWAKSMGGAFSDQGVGLALDRSGNVYSVGSFWGTVDFDPGAGVHNLNSNGYYDVYVNKFDSSGEFVWAKNIGGTATDSGGGIEIDNGYVYITGSFKNTVDFDPAPGISNLTSAGYDDTFVSKFDIDGNFVWAKSMEGVLNSGSYGIALDSVGDVYTIGSFVGTVDFDPGAGAYNLNDAGGGDIYLSKLGKDGSFIWAKRMGGPIYDYGLGLVVDRNGNVYSVGDFSNTSDFDPGAGIYNLTSAGYLDGFVSKLVNSNSSTLISTGTLDGWLLESGESSDRGGTLNKTATSFYLGDNVQKKQYRSVLSFTTKGLPDNARITKVTLKVKRQGTVGSGNPVNIFQGFLVDVKQGFFGSAPGLQVSDFQLQADKTLGPFKPALKNGWYTFNLTAAWRHINKRETDGGVTQIRLRFKLDDNNNTIANFLTLYSGNAPAASRPQLIVEYYVP